MGALLSLPIAGFFLMPSLTSYSTSLNLLFFYMTWSTLVLSHPPLRVEAVGTVAIWILFFLVPSLLFLVFDSIFPSLAVGIKRQGEAALPTRSSSGRASRKSRSQPPWYQVLGLSLFNVCLSVGIQISIEYLFTELLQIRSALKVTTTLPMPWSIFKDVARGLVLREVIQYYPHRFILHARRPNFLSRLHKEYYHSITAPYSLATHYDHPLPYLLLRFLPTYLPSLIFRAHLLTYILLLSIITLEETLTMSGYSTIPGIMLGGFARRQDLHSESRGRGNFAPWGFLDWVHGTSVGGDIMEDAGEEAEKHQLGERGGRAWNNAKDAGREGVRALSGRRRGGKK